MSITLRGRGYIHLHAADWVAVKKIAFEFGWVPEYERKAAEDTGPQYDDVPKHNARALASALYRAIHMVETDSLSESLVELVKKAGVGNMRAVADLAATGTFYAD